MVGWAAADAEIYYNGMVSLWTENGKSQSLNSELLLSFKTPGKKMICEIRSRVVCLASCLTVGLVVSLLQEAKPSFLKC